MGLDGLLDWLFAERRRLRSGSLRQGFEADFVAASWCRAAIFRTSCEFSEHRAVVDAIASREPDAAEAAMRLHLGHVTDALRASSSTTVAA